MHASVSVLGVGAVSPLGFSPMDLASLGSQPHERELEVPRIPTELDAGDRRARKLMSRGAHLAAIALRAALVDTAWESGAEVGLFMGVGASAASMKDLRAVLRASFEDGELSMARLGSKGLRSFNPLHTFMLLPNFSMCHGALLEGTTGPNGVYFSRGSGTVVALMEARHAVASGACQQALCGGADSALHPLSRAEFAREGREDEGLRPSEGAGVIAFGFSDEPDRIDVEAVAIHPARRSGLQAAAMAAAMAVEGNIDTCIITPWGHIARTILSSEVTARWPDATLIDSSLTLGESLAASPALAWVAAISHLRQRAGRIAVLSAGIDGDLGIVLFTRANPS